MNLRKLQQRRLNWVAASRENRFEGGIKRLLADLYPDNAHFIYELLQNANDARNDLLKNTPTLLGRGTKHEREAFEPQGRRLTLTLGSENGTRTSPTR